MLVASGPVTRWPAPARSGITPIAPCAASGKTVHPVRHPDLLRMRTCRAVLQPCPPGPPACGPVRRSVRLRPSKLVRGLPSRLAVPSVLHVLRSTGFRLSASSCRTPVRQLPRCRSIAFVHPGPTRDEKDLTSASFALHLRFARHLRERSARCVFRCCNGDLCRIDGLNFSVNFPAVRPDS